MDTSSSIFVAVLLGGLSFAAYVFLVGGWAWRDAEKRGKPGWLVAVIVLFGAFPLGLLAWLVFRPEPLDPKAIFHLHDFRVQ